MTTRALRFNLVLDDVSITHVAFSPEFTHAVEAKQVGVFGCRLISVTDIVTGHIVQVAQQTARRAAFLVDQAIQEKQVSLNIEAEYTRCQADFSPSVYYCSGARRSP